MVVIVAVVAYAPTMHDYFLQDDFGVVGLLSQKPAFYFPRWFVGPWTDNIWGYVPDEVRPFPAVSYQIAAAFGAASPVPNHVVNIALHGLNGLLALWIAQEAAGLSLVPATAAALVFVVLPIQAESVAWITGRVDSLPACFYFASFLLYVRSVRLKPDTTDTTEGVTSRTLYLWSLALFFCALFSKQNTITLAPALVLHDLLVRRRSPVMSWRWLRPYVPYILLTAGFLVLRYVLFHEVAREGVLNAQRVREFVSDSSRHLVRLVFGGAGIRHWAVRDTGIVALSLVAVACLARLAGAGARARWRPAVYFGVIWIAVGMAPILVSGYYSPRHMYLASLGWAVAIGVGVDILWQARPARYARPVAALVAAAIVVAYAAQLRQVVHDWNLRAAISQKAIADLEREAISAPEGALVIIGAPAASWAFAAPLAFRPPFTDFDLTQRISVVSDSTLYCCAANLWNDYTRRALRTWLQRADRPPVIAMYWDRRTGALTRVSETDDPQLRTLMSILLDTDGRAALDSVIRGLLNDFVAVHATPATPTIPSRAPSDR